MRNKNLSSIIEVFILVLIVITCAIPRVFFLSTIPPGLHGDEAWTGLDAIKILQEGYIGPYVPGALGEPSGPIYFTAFIFKLFDSSIFWLRFSMAFFGIITIPLFYIFLRLFFKKFVSYLGTLFLGMSLIHVYYSRVGFKVIAAPVFAILSLIFLIRAARSKKNIEIALCGIFCGLGVYSYNAYIVFPVTIFSLLLIRIFISRFSSLHIKRFIVFTIFFLLSSSQLINFFIQNPNAYLSHFKQVSINSPSYEETTSLISKTILVLNNGFYNIKHFFIGNSIDYADGFGKYRTFDISIIFLFLGGTIVALIKVVKGKNFIYLFFIISFIFLLFSSGFGSINSSAIHRRQIVTIIYIFFFVALSIDFLSKVKHSAIRKTSLIAIVIILFLTSAANLKIYFQKFANDSELKWVYAYQLVKASDFIKTLPQPAYVYFYSARWSYHYETLRFLLNDIPGEDRSSQFGTYSLINNNVDKTVVYLFLPDYQDSFLQAQKMYPNGKAITKKDTDKTILFYSYIIPKKL